MTLRAFLELASLLAKHNSSLLDSELHVPTCNPSIGGGYLLPVTGLHGGFDWENGRAIIETEEDLFHVGKNTRPERVEVAEVVKHTKQSPTVLALKHRGGFMCQGIMTDVKAGDILYLARPPGYVKPTPPVPAPKKAKAVFSCKKPTCTCAKKGVHPRQCIDDQKKGGAA